MQDGNKEIIDNHKLSINEWNEESRPRERLLHLGPEALTDAELLAILIHSGTPRQDAVSLMTEVLHACNDNLDRLGEMTYEQLVSFNGIGPAKAVTLMAACEFGRRRMKKTDVAKLKLDSSGKIFEALLKQKFWDKTEEECWVVILSQSLRLISMELVGKGGLTSVSADIRKIMKLAVQKDAAALVLAHNHPSGSLQPGQADDRTTHNLKSACEVMDIRLLDHLVVNGEHYFSYAESGRL